MDDSELKEILEKLRQQLLYEGTRLTHSEEHATRNSKLYVSEALQAIKALYISRKEVEEAIGEDELLQAFKALYRREIEEALKDEWVEITDPDQVDYGKKVLNPYRDVDQLRAKLLPPTKGGNEQ